MRGRFHPLSPGSSRRAALGAAQQFRPAPPAGGPLVKNLPMSEYLVKPETWLFLLHNAVLDIHYNRLPGVVFWPGNIGGIVNGPLWSLPCEALLYLMLFGLGVCRLLTLPVSLILLATGILCLQIDLVDNSFGSALWLLGFFAAGMCLYRLRRFEIGRAHV